MTTLSGHIATPDGIIPGTLSFGTTINTVEPGPAPDRFILPGFIDVHVHGGGGGDAMDGPDGVASLARFHFAHGTTTMLPTTITRPWPEVLAALDGIAEARRRAAGLAMPDGALIHGAHLEGPFINPARLGAQPPFTVLPTAALVREVLSRDIVRVVTLACEMPGADAAIDLFSRSGVRVSLGHSAADFDTATAAIARTHGCPVCGTHLFNAMGGIEGRKPGLAGAILASDMAFAELILDLHHVHPGSFRLARAALGDRLMLITDAIRATGQPDGVSELGGQAVMVCNGAARLEDGTLAGSVLTMDAALRHAIACSVPLVDAARLAATNAAAYLGLTDRGAIRPGLRADLVVLGPDLDITEVWIAGRRGA
jgi:N-acetylglucosamine-6-phosphate deacetylase